MATSKSSATKTTSYQKTNPSDNIINDIDETGSNTSESLTKIKD